MVLLLWRCSASIAEMQPAWPVQAHRATGGGGLDGETEFLVSEMGDAIKLYTAEESHQK